MVSCDFYCINKWGGCWCLLSVTKNFYLFGRKHCYELMNLKRHLLIVNTVLCKKQKWKKNTRPFSFIWIASVNWILSRHHFCWWNKDISLCIVNRLVLTLKLMLQCSVNARLVGEMREGRLDVVDTARWISGLMKRPPHVVPLLIHQPSLIQGSSYLWSAAGTAEGISLQRWNKLFWKIK